MIMRSHTGSGKIRYALVCSAPSGLKYFLRDIDNRGRARYTAKLADALFAAHSTLHKMKSTYSAALAGFYVTKAS